jgi:hypothetical protein
VDSTYFFDRLYPFQDAVLREMAALDTGFYLTGGTAASRGYLGHRFSDDLDFFVNDAPLFSLWSDRVTATLAGHREWTTRVLLRESRFVRLEVGAVDVVLKLEFVNDVPSRIGAVSHHPTLGRLDSAENILANKLTALADRNEPKDVADIWGFCCRRGMPLGPALTSASSKAAGLFPPDLARRLLTASEDDWRVIRWIDPPDPSSFLADLKRLGEDLLLLPPPG